jgi:hypothetical protein
MPLKPIIKILARYLALSLSLSLSLQFFIGVERMELINSILIFSFYYEILPEQLFSQKSYCSFNLEHLTFIIYFYPTGFT